MNRPEQTGQLHDIVINDFVTFGKIQNNKRHDGLTASSIEGHPL